MPSTGPASGSCSKTSIASFCKSPSPCSPDQGRTVFDLRPEEWQATYDLLQQARHLLDDEHAPGGYTVGWNCEDVGGQETFHAHLHVIPRFEEEPLAGKGLRFPLKQPANERAQPEE